MKKQSLPKNNNNSDKGGDDKQSPPTWKIMGFPSEYEYTHRRMYDRPANDVFVEDEYDFD